MGDEVHVVTRQETFNDYAVRELAQSNATCLCRLQFKRCSIDKCVNCNTHKRIQNCKASMSDFDIERLQHYTSVYYAEYSCNPTAWMSHEEYKRHYTKFVVALILFLFLFLVVPMLLIGPLDTPDSIIDYNTAIINTVRVAQSQVYDLDEDGKVNCVDYAIMFKLVWDKSYPRLKANCTIIRNRNWLTDMNHLFICIIDNTGENIWVEPGTFNPSNYRMENVWGDRYDPLCNRYGETEYWLREVK